MSEFKVSVVVPVYNAEKYIKKAIESALMQSEVGEVIAVEDKSPDLSLKLLSEMAQNEPRLQVYQHPDKQNHGAGVSRNLGIVKSRFDYVAFLDADDYYLPGRFAKDKEVFAKNTSAEGVYNALGTDYYEDVENAMIPKQFLTTITKELDSKDLFKALVTGESGWIHSNALTLKRSVFEKSGLFDTTIDLVEDTDLWIKVSAVCTLLPGEIIHPVAMRGVHRENRINNTAILNHNRPIMYSRLLKWAIEKKLPADKKRLLWNVYFQTNIDHVSRKPMKRFTDAVVQAVHHPFLLGYADYYKTIPFLSRVLK